VNTELELASLQTFDDWKQLYQWIRAMLTVNDLAPSFKECMDGLCRCVHLP
jgi:hypothetical protein